MYLLDRQVTAAAAYKCIHLASRAHHQIRCSMTLTKLGWLISKEASEMGSTNSSSKEWHVVYKIINIWNVMIIEAGKLATQEVCPSDYSVNLNLGGSNSLPLKLSIKAEHQGFGSIPRLFNSLPATRLTSMSKERRQK